MGIIGRMKGAANNLYDGIVNIPNSARELADYMRAGYSIKLYGLNEEGLLFGFVPLTMSILVAGILGFEKGDPLLSGLGIGVGALSCIPIADDILLYSAGLSYALRIPKDKFLKELRIDKRRAEEHPESSLRYKIDRVRDKIRKSRK